MEAGPLLEPMELVAPDVVEAQKPEVGHAQILHLLKVALIVVDHPQSLQTATRTLAVSHHFDIPRI